MSSTQEPIIKIQSLRKKYYNKVVVDNINLEIPDSCFAFLGPNGAGKTTTMLMLLGLVKPSNGTATIFGTNILNRSGKIRRKIGFLPENVGFYPNLTGQCGIIQQSGHLIQCRYLLMVHTSRHQIQHISQVWIAHHYLL
ncbi:hypothetical protein LCGC14_1800020 [marine sediment metagenome]|uniref:ABC transporter domain-containing protein n=1 Tax=marine sediment metagenome TaxID=412755 RepID=A0A0F9J4Q6_9ZZZZ